MLTLLEKRLQPVTIDAWFDDLTAVEFKDDTLSGISPDDIAINSAISMVMDMRENYGIFCTIVKYPAVPPGTLMIRFMPTANHTMDQVEHTLSSMREMKAKLDAGGYDNQALLKQ